MRSVNLLKFAAEAELLRYRCMAARQGRRAAFGAVALVFVLAVLVLGEVAAWLALCLRFAAIPTTLILLGINLIIAIAFGLLAARSSPSHAEREALQVRQQSLDAARGMLSLAALVPVGNTLLRHWRNNRSLVRDSERARPQLPTLQVVPTEPFNQYDRLSGAVVKQIAKNATHCRSD